MKNKKHKNTISLIGHIKYIAIIVSMLFIFGCSGTRPQNIGVNDGQLSACPDKPNCVSSQAGDSDHFIAPIAYTVKKEVAFKVMKQIIQTEKKAMIVTESPHYLHAEFKSKILKFVDDVEFYFPDSEPVIHVRSASRLGYSDLGVNRKRIEKIKTLFTNKTENL